jgi:ribosome-associated translation inhibitor RaiA
MKRIVEFKDWTPEPDVNEVLEAEIDRLERLVRGLRTESLAIRIVIDRNETRTLYRVTILMELPGPDVSASEERHDLKEAVHDGFAEVRRQIEKHRRKLTHAVEYKRRTRRDRLRRLRAGVEPAKRRRPTGER